MGGVRAGILGTEADARAPKADDSGIDLFGGGDPPGILGGDGAIPLDDVSRTILKIVKDWEPPQLRTTPPIVIRGATLEAAGRELDKLNEWGEGGGFIRTEKIKAGNSTNLSVHMFANLIRRLPTWTGYGAASTAAKAEWDRMFAKLQAHEDRHVAIAVAAADKLAAALVGQEIDQIVQMVTDANNDMQTSQNDLDNDTDHGAKTGVPFGDVFLDTTIV